jgi:phage baseplate assembly protein W
MQIDYPFHFDTNGRTATTDQDDHVRDMIEQVLFTTPGERVNRRDFGCGLLQSIFEPLGDAFSAALQSTVRGALIQWLSDVATIEDVGIQTKESTVTVTVRYVVRGTEERRTAHFSRNV